MSYGRRYGLVGRNGIGKTTLLRMLAGRQLQIATHLTVLHVEQEVEGDDTLALDSVLECDIKRHDLLQEEKQITAQLQLAAPGYFTRQFSSLPILILRGWIMHLKLNLLPSCISSVSCIHPLGSFMLFWSKFYFSACLPAIASLLDAQTYSNAT